MTKAMKFIREKMYSNKKNHKYTKRFSPKVNLTNSTVIFFAVYGFITCLNTQIFYSFFIKMFSLPPSSRVAFCLCHSIRNERDTRSDRRIIWEMMWTSDTSGKDEQKRFVKWFKFRCFFHSMFFYSKHHFIFSPLFL